MRAAVDLLLYAGVLLVELLVRCLPPGAAMALAEGAGRIWFRLDRRRRERARENLATAARAGLPVPDLSALVAACFGSLIRVPMEAFLFPRFFRTPLQMKRRVRCRGDWADLQANILAGTGGLLVTGHLGNWEALGWALRFLGGPVRVVARPIANPWIERRVRRARGGDVAVIPKRGAVRSILRTLRAGGWVGFVGDQNAGRHGVFVPFFGRAASTFPAPAVLAVRLGVPLYAGVCFRLPGRPLRFEVDVRRLPPAPAGLEEGEAARRLLAAFLATLEGWVARAPEQYNWIHRRWKTRPPGG